jgi:hypothetical protein
LAAHIIIALVTVMNDTDNPCKCGHPFASHTRDVIDTDAMKADYPVPPRGLDIFSGGEVGKSGCTECSCRQWMPADH